LSYVNVRARSVYLSAHSSSLIKAALKILHITKGYPGLALLIISLETFRTRIVLLHAHTRDVPVDCSCVKFHQY